MTIHDPNALVPVGTAELPAVVLALDIEKAADLARQEKAQATRRAYASDFQIFGAMVRRPWRKRTTGRR